VDALSDSLERQALSIRTVESIGSVVVIMWRVESIGSVVVIMWRVKRFLLIVRAQRTCNGQTLRNRRLGIA